MAQAQIAPVVMSDVFISYSRNDEQFVRELAQTLQEHNVPFWLDSIQIRPGDDWIRQINAAIDHASAVVVVLSPNSQSSEWVQTELKYALAHMKPVVPVLIEGDPGKVIPRELRNFQYVDVRNRNHEKVEDLVRLLNKTPALP
jgi:hypothetical protein